MTDTVPTSDAILKITHYIPLTRCNEILRQIAVGGEYTGMLPGLCIVALVWLVIGSVFFDVMLKRQRSGEICCSISGRSENGLNAE